MSAQVCQKFLGSSETFVAGPTDGDPVAGMRKGVTREHEAVGVERVGEGAGSTGRGQRGWMERMEVWGRVHQWES